MLQLGDWKKKRWCIPVC